MKRRMIFLCASIITLGVVTGSVWYFLANRPLQTLTPITFSPKWVNQAQFAGVFVAIDKGFYKKRGLDVHVREFQEGQSVVEDITSGTSQLGLMSANDLLINVSQGKALKGIAAFYQLSPFVIISLKQLGITSPTDLKGKTFGVKGGAGAEGESVYAIILKAAGLDTSDLQFTYLPFGTREYEDLLAERVDAIGLYRIDELYQFELQNIAYNIIYPERYGSSAYNDVLVGTSEYLQAHPKEARAFIKATQEGWRYAFAHEDEAVSITKRYVTQENYKNTLYEKYILEQSKPLIDTGSTKIGEMDLRRWKTYVQTLTELGILPAGFAISSAVTAAFLP